MDAADNGSFFAMLCHEYCMKAVPDPNYPRCNKFWRVYDRWIMWIGIILSFFGFWCTLGLGLGFTTIESDTGCCGIFIDSEHSFTNINFNGLYSNKSYVLLIDPSLNTTIYNNIPHEMVVEKQCSIESLSENPGLLGYETIDGNTMCTMDGILCNQFYTQDFYWRLEIDTYIARRRRRRMQQQSNNTYNQTSPGGHNQISSLDKDIDDPFFQYLGYGKIDWDVLVEFYIWDRYTKYNQTTTTTVRSVNNTKCNSAFFESHASNILGNLWFYGILVLFHMLNEWILSVCECQKRNKDSYCTLCDDGNKCDPERIKDFQASLTYTSCILTCFCCCKCWGNPLTKEGKKKCIRSKGYSMKTWIMILWVYALYFSGQIDTALDTGYFTSHGYFDIYDNDTIIFDASGFENVRFISELFSFISILSVIMALAGCILAYCPCIKKHKYVDIKKEEDVELMKQYEIECAKQDEMDPSGTCGYKGLCPCFFEKESKCYAPFGCDEKCSCCFDDDNVIKPNEKKVVELVINGDTKKNNDDGDNIKNEGGQTQNKQNKKEEEEEQEEETNNNDKNNKEYNKKSKNNDDLDNNTTNNTELTNEQQLG